jgi:DNA-binding transcriptional MerR regulator/DNA gyrase inhibitor GyrI
MLTIGDFSTATRLSVKALRIYHEDGLLVPEKIDPVTGYRFYGDASFRKATAISLLRDLGFSLKDMKGILESCADDADLVSFFEKRLKMVEGEIAEKRRIRNSISFFIETQKEETMGENMKITEMELPTLTILGIRYRGRYDECGVKFGTLYKGAGRYVTGVPFCLYHSVDHDEGNADIEACVAVRKAVTVEGAVCHVLPGGKGVSIVYRGPYEGIGEAYKALFEYLNDKGLQAKIPSREFYLKGPGMILPRSPKKYVTEIQVLV